MEKCKSLGGNKNLFQITETSQVHSLSSLLNNQDKGNKIVRYVCVGSTLESRVEDYANKLGVEILILPRSLSFGNQNINRCTRSLGLFSNYKTAPSMKLTTPSAWSVICTLVKLHSASIREISKNSNVSYGWTHSVIKGLEALGIVEIEGFVTRLKNVNQLLNVIAWERPLGSLIEKRIMTYFENSNKCISELTSNLTKLGIEHAFTSHSASMHYGSTTIRRDAVYLYVKGKQSIDVFKEFEDHEKGKCELVIFLPDRNVFEQANTINGVSIVSMCQYLLDLAGMGTGSRGVAAEMVAKIGTL